jgi:hypothetical protein
LSRWEIRRVPPSFWASAGSAAKTEAAKLTATNATTRRILFPPRRRTLRAWLFPRAARLAHQVQRPSQIGVMAHAAKRCFAPHWTAELQLRIILMSGPEGPRSDDAEVA